MVLTLRERLKFWLSYWRTDLQERWLVHFGDLHRIPQFDRPIPTPLARSINRRPHERRR